MTTDPESTTPIYRVVVGVDFTPTCDYALDEALRIAWNTDNDELHLVHVIKDKNVRSGGAIARDERLIEDAYARLRQLVLERGGALSARQWSQKVFYHVRLGDPADCIHQACVDVDADIVVVGTHRRTGVERVLLGSVAHKLLKEGRVPLLVARPKTYDGLTKTPMLEPPKPGADVHAKRPDMIYSSERVVFGKRDSHIPGLL